MSSKMIHKEDHASAIETHANTNESAKSNLMTAVDLVKQELVEESQKVTQNLGHLKDKVSKGLQGNCSHGNQLLQKHVTKRSYGFTSVLVLFGLGFLLGKVLK